MFQKMGIHDPASIIFEIKAVKSSHDLFFFEGGGGGGGEGRGGGGGGKVEVEVGGAKGEFL